MIINDFEEVFNWICYDYEKQYGINRDDQGNFYVNKLYITKDSLSYKTENYTLAPGLFEKVEKLFSLFNENSIRFIKED
jgi:hypothetical protein